jgi:Cyclic phosphodiesterase-like protein
MKKLPPCYTMVIISQTASIPIAMSKNATLVYWLVPAQPARELFRELIRILSKEFDAPRFEPHLTIFAEPQNPQSDVLRRLKAKRVRLQIRGISYSAKFTKTLFVRLNSNKSLEKLVADLGDVAKKPIKSPVEPHISLLYKKLPPSVKRQLTSTIKLPFKQVIFDSIKTVRCTAPTRDSADVKAWRIVATRNLTR